ncbi:GatB/YqeY domain-containing protein [Leptolyngbyaceae cyanobacterium UHCC 1019]
MGLKERISDDIKLAMKAQDKIRLETVRNIKKVILEKESAIRPSGQESLTEEQEIEIVVQLAKQRRDSIAQYQQAGRTDLANQETQELTILEEYLPKQLSDDEISQIIETIISQTGATSTQEMGKVIGTAMQQLKGKADGKKVQEMVKAKLGGE